MYALAGIYITSLIDGMSISMSSIKFEYFNHDVPVCTSRFMNDEYLFIAFRRGAILV